MMGYALVDSSSCHWSHRARDFRAGNGRGNRASKALCKRSERSPRLKADGSKGRRERRDDESRPSSSSGLNLLIGRVVRSRIMSEQPYVSGILNGDRFTRLRIMRIGRNFVHVARNRARSSRLVLLPELPFSVLFPVRRTRRFFSHVIQFWCLDFCAPRKERLIHSFLFCVCVCVCNLQASVVVACSAATPFKSDAFDNVSQTLSILRRPIHRRRLTIMKQASYAKNIRKVTRVTNT